jgi:hypothetical protein
VSLYLLIWVAFLVLLSPPDFPIRDAIRTRVTGHRLQHTVGLWMFTPVVRYSPRDPAGAVINIFDS